MIHRPVGRDTSRRKSIAAILCAALWIAAGGIAHGAGWFGGAGYGAAAWRHYALSRDSTEMDNSDRGGLAFAGYRFTKHFGVAASAVDMGGMKAVGPMLGGFIDRQEATGLSAALMGIVPLRDRLGLFGTFGWVRWRHKSRYEDNRPLNNPGTIRTSSRGSSLCWGLGLNMYVSPSSTWGVHGEWTRYIDVGDEKVSRHSIDIDLFTLGVVYSFPR